MSAAKVYAGLRSKPQGARLGGRPLGDRRRVDRPLVECGRGPLARLEDLCCATGGCGPALDVEPPESFDAWYAANCDPAELPDGAYTPDEIDWLVRATRGIERASERFADLACSPYPAPACHAFRACWPCGCAPRIGCSCRSANIFDVPLCGDPLSAVLRRWDDAGVSLDDLTLGDGLAVINGVLVAPGCHLTGQDPLSALGDPCTWELEVVHGTRIDDVPWIIREAIADTACAMMQRCLPKSKCEAPSNAKTMFNDGIEYELIDMSELLSGSSQVKAWNEALDQYRCSDLIEGSTNPCRVEAEWFVRSCEVVGKWL